MTMEQPREIQWIGAVSRQHTPLFLSYVISGQDRDLIEELTGLPVGFKNMRRVGSVLQFDSSELALARSEIRRRWADSGLSIFENYADRCIESCEAILANSRSVLGSTSRTDFAPSSIQTAFEAYSQGPIRHSAFIETMLLMQFELEDRLAEFITERRPSSCDRDADWLAASLKMALDPTYEIQNIRGLLEIGVQVQASVADWVRWPSMNPADLIPRIASSHSDVWSALEKYARGFAWMGLMYYVGEPLTPASAVLRLQNVLRTNCIERLEAARALRTKELERREEAIEVLGGNAGARSLAGTVSRYMHLRSHRLDVFFIVHDMAMSLMAAICDRFRLPTIDDTAYIDWREYARAFSSSSIDLGRLALERRRGFEFSSLGGLTEWKSTEAGLIRGEPLSDHFPLRGVTAGPGTAEGLVRIIMNPDDTLVMRRERSLSLP